MIDLSQYNTDDVKKLIFTRQHAGLSACVPIWKFMLQSYLGGDAYRNSSNLFQYSKENTIDYSARLKRSVYVNPVEPLINLLTGILFNTDVERKIPEKLTYAESSVSSGKGMSQYMLSVALHAVMYPMFILVDSPAVDEELNEAERQSRGINPYCVTYFPWQVRDFAIDDNGLFQWIMLDNTRIEKKTPFSAEEKKEQYRLWTPNVFIDYTRQEKDILAGEPFEHGRGIVPVTIFNANDINFDHLNDSIFEDIALLARLIYNTMSMLDESLMAGTIKTLFFPCETRKDLPEEILQNGLGGLPVVPFPAKGPAPTFDGPDIQDVQYYITAIDFYIRQIFTKVGMSEDREKSFTQSGSAKLLEYRKTELFLKQFACQLEKTERAIFKLLGKWEGLELKDDEIKIKYSANIVQEDVDTHLARMAQGLTLQLKTLEKAIKKRIPRAVVPDLTEEEEKEINDEIEEKANEPEQKFPGIVKPEIPPKQDKEDEVDDDAEVKDV